ncbi:NUDIX hydrolase [Methylobacterium sp. W2]|uniref:NUDIX hydrolase n=1 Tax=Methylobacterium sp. W2 TaxID=2598107 RepID=UPI001D0C0F41|nr:NUDIX hydrolase [Methylobacterium sp. W2]MCC0808459.1 NUDIX hydrolase [Methylobacterium sp. W2]
MSDGFTLTRIERVTARLVPFEWEWARDNAAVIAENWRCRCAARSGLFDGRVLLAKSCRIEGTSCSVELFETSYASFITHKDLGSPDPRVLNAFAAIVPQGSDGAVLLGMMGAHTANAGQAYFPCGTPDLDDVRDGDEVDLAGSAEREFVEETGMALPADAPEAWLLLRGRTQAAFLRPVIFRERADALREEMERHRRAEIEPELAGFITVASSGEIDPRSMPNFVQAYLRHVFQPSCSSTFRSG